MAKKRPANDQEEREKPSAASDQAQKKRLDGYPGAALTVGPDGAVICSNDKAAGLEALMQHDAAPEIKNLIEEARTQGSVTAGSVRSANGSPTAPRFVGRSRKGCSTATAWSRSGCAALVTRPEISTGRVSRASGWCRSRSAGTSRSCH